MRRIPPPLLLLLAVAATMSLAWNVSTAPLQGPDEAEHVAYVEHLAETGSKPSPTSGNRPFGTDEAEALSQFRLFPMQQNPAAKPDWSETALNNFKRFEAQLDATARGAGVGINATGSNPPLYYAVETIGWKLTPGRGFLDRLFVMRLISGLLLLATVTFAWLLAGEVFRRQLPQMVATAFVALTPMAGFMGGIVNPDIALAAAWTAFLWLSLRMVRLGLSPSRAALTTLAAVAGVLIHGRSLAIVPALIVALAVAWAVGRPPLRRLITSAASAGAVAIAGAVIYRLTTAAAAGAGDGGQLSVGGAAFNFRQLLSSVWEFYLPRLSMMQPRLGPEYGFHQVFIEQFFGGTFGLNEVILPLGVYDVVQIIVALVLIAFYTIMIRNWRIMLARWPTVVIVGFTSLALLALLHVASYRALLGGDNPLITGRYLLPLVAVFGLVVASIIAGLPRKAAAVTAGLFLGSSFILALSALAMSLERFYA